MKKPCVASLYTYMSNFRKPSAIDRSPLPRRIQDAWCKRVALILRVSPLLLSACLAPRPDRLVPSESPLVVGTLDEESLTLTVESDGSSYEDALREGLRRTLKRYAGGNGRDEEPTIDLRVYVHQAEMVGPEDVSISTHWRARIGSSVVEFPLHAFPHVALTEEPIGNVRLRRMLEEGGAALVSEGLCRVGYNRVKVLLSEEAIDTTKDDVEMSPWPPPAVVRASGRYRYPSGFGACALGGMLDGAGGTRRWVSLGSSPVIDNYGYLFVDGYVPPGRYQPALSCYDGYSRVLRWGKVSLAVPVQERPVDLGGFEFSRDGITREHHMDGDVPFETVEPTPRSSLERKFGIELMDRSGEDSGMCSTSSQAALREKPGLEERRRSELFKVVRSGGLERIKELLYFGLDVDSADSNGVTALHIAAFEGRSEVVELLLEHDATIGKADARGRDAIDYAALGGQQEIRQFLLQVRQGRDGD